MRSLAGALALLCLALGGALAEERPFYIIGHMVNTVNEAKDFLSQGANSLEIDVSFNNDNISDLRAFHNIPCDCFRVCRRSDSLADILGYLRGQQDRLALLFLDLKLSQVPEELKKSAGEALAVALVKHLWRGSDSGINVLLSIEKPSDSGAVVGAMSALGEYGKSRVGWDVSQNAELDTIRDHWKELGLYPGPLWQGDGITNCLSPFRRAKRLKEALSERNSPDGYIAKVYSWTVDLRFHLRYSLEHRVDGVITNHPSRALEIVRNWKPGVFRVAIPQDNPWKKIRDPPAVEASYPSDSKLQRIIMRFPLKQMTQDIGDSTKDLIASLLDSSGLLGRQSPTETELRELYNYLEEADESLGEDSEEADSSEDSETERSGGVDLPLVGDPGMWSRRENGQSRRYAPERDFDLHVAYRDDRGMAF